MAAGQHNPSRRALLGAAVALPLLGVGDLSPAPTSTSPPGDGRSPSPAKAAEELAWARALGAYEAAEAEVLEADAWPAEYEDEYGERLDALCAALGHLLRTPAPDARALALKIGIAIEHELATPASAAACLAAIRGDAQRLAAASSGL